MHRLLIVIAGIFIIPGNTTIGKTATDNKIKSNMVQMKDDYYTHALWHIKEGKADEFIAAWKKFGISLSEMPDAPPAQGTLIQSLTDPLVFYSFGPWENLEDNNAMRSNENVKKALSEIIALCQEAKPGSYKTIAKLSFPGTKK
ncbi:MAG TPA: hypothetical protein VNA26_09060 [Chitinophagaceae bacterium]|nr:hypothetical protein [Chitinophagaceae bacterium]